MVVELPAEVGTELIERGLARSAASPARSPVEAVDLAISVARSTWISRREALGVVNCLLALGVEEVIAPVEAVDDLATGIFGAGLAQAYRPAAGAGETLLHARLDLERISPELRREEGLEWIRAGVASGAVVAADALQVDEAEAGLRRTATADVAHVGEGFGVFGTGPVGRLTSLVACKAGRGSPSAWLRR